MLFPLGKSFLFLAASIYVLAVCRNFYVSNFNPLNTKQSNIKSNKQIQSKPHQYYIKRIGQGQYRLFNLKYVHSTASESSSKSAGKTSFRVVSDSQINPIISSSVSTFFVFSLYDDVLFYVHCFLTLLLKKFTYVSFFYYQERIIVLKKKLKRRKK